MTTLQKIQIQWSGTKGLPGVSTFYAEDAQSNVIDALKIFFETFNNNIPTGVRLKYPSSGLNIDSVSGQAVGGWSQATAPADTVCTGSGGFAAPVGCVVNWHSGSYVGGRELRGKTFIVPLIGSQFDDGTLLTQSLGEFQSAANAFIASAPTFRVWSKKTGITRPVVTASIPDKACVLRSRRD